MTEFPTLEAADAEILRLREVLARKITQVDLSPIADPLLAEAAHRNRVLGVVLAAMPDGRFYNVSFDPQVNCTYEEASVRSLMPMWKALMARIAEDEKP